MTTYIRVSDDEGGECIEIPVEDDGTLYLSTLVAQFPGACGLKYRNPDTKSLRGVKFIEERLICPDEGWVFDFFCTFPKSECKRKSSDILESSNSTKSKKLDIYDKCTDLIVLDLPWKTTEKELRDYFVMFGNVIMAQLKKDPKSGQSRGYGFVRFEDLEIQKQVLATRHIIGGRSCDVRIPKSKDPDNPYLSSKIFVGRITEDFTEQDIRDYFGQFGEVTYVFIPKKPFRAFSFVQFIEPRAAMEVCEQDEHLIKGVTVSVSCAKQRKEPPKVPGREGGTNFNSSDSNFNSDAGFANYNSSSNGLNSSNYFNSSSNGMAGFANHSSAGFGVNGGGEGSYNTHRAGEGDGYGNRGARGKRGVVIKRRGVGGGRNDGWNGGGMDWNEQRGWNTGSRAVDSSGVDYNALAADVVAAITQQLGVMGPPPPPHRHY